MTASLAVSQSPEEQGRVCCHIRWKDGNSDRLIITDWESVQDAKESQSVLANDVDMHLRAFGNSGWRRMGMYFLIFDHIARISFSIEWGSKRC